MTKKKNQSTPLPQQAEKSKNQLKNKESPSSGTFSIPEKEEIVSPGPNIVHPSAGPIPRKNVEVIEQSHRLMFGELQVDINEAVSQNKGTSSKSRPTLDNPAITDTYQDNPGTSPNSETHNWANLFNGALSAKDMKLGFVTPVIKEGKPVVKLNDDELLKDLLIGRLL